MVAMNLWSLTPVKFAVAEIQKDEERQLSGCRPGQGAGRGAMWGL